VGVRIRELRRAAGLTQAQLARQLPGLLEANQISRWERGRMYPSWANVEALAVVLGVTEEDLLCGGCGRPDCPRALLLST
jgi:transcriptional regulator with XRE-family HTH domain